MRTNSRPIDTRTKIIATIGPSCREVAQLVELIDEGVDVFRINAAHGDRTDFASAVANVREASQRTQRPIATLFDLAGPKIRLGELSVDPTHCHHGSVFRFVRGDTSQTENELVSNYERLIDELSVGNSVMLADGTVSMIVTDKTADHAECQVTAAGVVRSRQGINLRGAKLSVPSMTDEDVENAKWAAQAGIDFVGLSFVRSADDVAKLKDLLRSHDSRAMVVAKIEKQEALDCLDEIVAVADVVMVARGDLGVEIDIAETPVAQKRIVAMCRDRHKPVIVATQMLDSMTHASRPTRAEATDVANAILDGADACMLSGETAIGKHPRLVVEIMRRIMHSTERLLTDVRLEPPSDADRSTHPISTAVVFGAAQIARLVKAKLVVIATKSGATGLVKSKQRDIIPTVGVSNCEETLRRMCLFWGITPLAGAPVLRQSELAEFIERWGTGNGVLERGDRVVFVTGSEVMPNVHNLVVVHEIS